MTREIIDNSLADLRFDFLDGCPREQVEDAPAKDEAAGEELQGGEDEGATASAVPVVRAGRSLRWHMWDALDVARTILIGLAVFGVGSLVFTMVMNPDLTFAQAVTLLANQAASLLEQAHRLFA